ncbi:hypothetical protein K437DRAFT_260377 [Tilletiaria anomala UBC 951]|uniref:SNF5-domain-containing protein n=1 Tax=Tilletiaria anomala (strain ATCC 24038 / CBS 436.72 / UBC 951) TaxID=1037660 RepID=A0A066VA21_TILAU|nr:uncharacterized protein K437DRAFT_260377 [Tilletiaria anomala UBC 951]KDN35410.1 hypothetical protein K437DRAFT_260377 [Tilletiaria anomala UBC 951]
MSDRARRAVARGGSSGASPVATPGPSSAARLLPPGSGASIPGMSVGMAMGMPFPRVLPGTHHPYVMQPQLHNGYPAQYTPQQFLPMNANNANGFAAVQHQQQQQQQTVRPWPLSNTSAPVPPFHMIGKGQALHTTFPSRMKVGVTTLMQPTPEGPDLYVPPALPGRRGAEVSTRAGVQPRRAAAARTYYHEDSGEDDDEEEDESEEDARKGGQDAKAGTPAEGEAEEESKKNFLGLPPPGNKIMIQGVQRTRHEYYNEYDMSKAADHREYLIPIKIELETEGHHIKDVFTWNRNEKLTTPRQFAKIFLQDLDLPIDPYAEIIASSIEQQIQDAHVADIEIGPSSGGPWATADAAMGQSRASLPEAERQKDSRQWDWGLKENFKPAFCSPNKRRRLDHAQLNGHPHLNGVGAHGLEPILTDDGERLDVGEPEDDLRVIVDYEVQILRHHLRDRLEWDLCSPLTPERFADQIGKDLGLSGEARPLIANALREQLLNHKRVVIDMDLLGSGAAYDAALKEIEAAKEQEADAARRKLAGLPPLLSIPSHIRQEMGSSRFSTGTSTPVDEPDTSGTPADGEDTPSTSAISDLPSDLTRRTTRRFQSPASADAEDQETEQLMTPTMRRQRAEAVIADLLNRGPRPLQGAWRDWIESRDFGPLLELITEEELEKLEAEALRASR